MLITLDTNIMYQALKSSSGASFYILQQVREIRIQIALSVPLFEEYEDVLKREKSLDDLELDVEDIDKFLRFIAWVGKPYKSYFLFRPNLKDEKDNMVVELAIASQSDYLVTSNVKDFDNAELRFDQLKVVTPAEFVKLWRSKDV
ncbi:putative toxin-antitoxin system toxin component, PIN family [Chlorobaculum sp. 24CR]|uniref:putative toxin-antitoxin system toxin component, PIN family n=1 Tax=Chlorobaculum sp. 24CR TaxID=2508878 RepID=UPI00100A9A95|nr:putative toxin-antitoxin system toxin component, PIN family [Chlorobaculum sp. 24CR]RXK87593.1 putative toxin-antitoxin system toxin component, PIN family [Chlorobaculum sp. 24CR]